MDAARLLLHEGILACRDRRQHFSCGLTEFEGSSGDRVAGSATSSSMRACTIYADVDLLV